jgi:hypothetical protein
MSPLDLMERLAALVPRPRLHLIRFHGVLAPHARPRPEIIPSPGHQAGHIPVPGIPGPGIPSVPVNTNTPSADHAEAPPAVVRLSWARLLKRVFEIDIEQCPQCGGTLKIIAAIEHPGDYQDPHTPRLVRPAPPRAAVSSIDSTWPDPLASRTSSGVAVRAVDLARRGRGIFSRASMRRRR